MPSEQEDDKNPHSTPSAPTNSDAAAAPRQAEDPLQRLQQLLANVQAERDEYRRILYPAIWEQFSEEELRRFAEDESEEGAQSLDQFLGELEDIVNGNQRTERP
jgi:hypothetical protein